MKWLPGEGHFFFLIAILATQILAAILRKRIISAPEHLRNAVHSLTLSLGGFSLFLVLYFLFYSIERKEAIGYISLATGVCTFLFSFALFVKNKIEPVSMK